MTLTETKLAFILPLMLFAMIQFGQKFSIYYLVCYFLNFLMELKRKSISIITPGRRQPETPILSRNVDKKLLETVFDCHLSPHLQQMAIENNVSIDF